MISVLTDLDLTLTILFIVLTEIGSGPDYNSLVLTEMGLVLTILVLS